MTREDLNRVRELKSKQISILRRLAIVNQSSEHLVMKLRMPGSRTHASPTEILAVKGEELRRRLSEMDELYLKVSEELRQELMRYDLTAKELLVIIKRYVKCERFKDIADEMGHSDYHIYRLHSDALKKILDS